MLILFRSFTVIRCPKCNKKLNICDKSYRCENGHSYDIAKKGYVNLLMSQVSKARHHGDDKIMSLSRRDFLDKGYYLPLAEAVCKSVKGKKFADIGCGECYYLSYIKDNIKDSVCVGIDISKEILEVASARTKPRGIVTAVASGANLPFEDECFDTLISVFAPISADEFYRVLKKDGIILRVTPDVDHLYELKQAVYDNPRKNDPLDMSLDGFEIVKTSRLTYTFTADKNDAVNLFAMTPYYYKTSPADRDKLLAVDDIKITADFDITIYRKFN